MRKRQRRTFQQIDGVLVEDPLAERPNDEEEQDDPTSEEDDVGPGAGPGPSPASDGVFGEEEADPDLFEQEEEGEEEGGGIAPGGAAGTSVMWPGTTEEELKEADIFFDEGARKRRQYMKFQEEYHLHNTVATPGGDSGGIPGGVPGAGTPGGVPGGGAPDKDDVEMEEEGADEELVPGSAEELILDGDNEGFGVDPALDADGGVGDAESTDSSSGSDTGDKGSSGKDEDEAEEGDESEDEIPSLGEGFVRSSAEASKKYHVVVSKLDAQGASTRSLGVWCENEQAFFQVRCNDRSLRENGGRYYSRVGSLPPGFSGCKNCEKGL